jgi:hypothetical protein
MEDIMTFEEILAAVGSAVIAFIVPRILKQAEKEISLGGSVPWFGWSLAGLIGGAIGGFASGLLAVFGLGLEGFGNWAVFGAALGLAQWFALGNYRPVSAWFPFASTLGWMIAMFGQISGGLTGAFIVAGIAVGLLQFFSMNKYAGAGWWFLGNLIAWPIAGTVGFFVGAVVTPMIGFELAWIVGWGVVGLVGVIILIVPLSRLKPKV